MKNLRFSGFLFLFWLSALWPVPCQALTPPPPPPCPQELEKKSVFELGKVVADLSADWKRDCSVDRLVEKGASAVPVLIKLLASEDANTWMLAVGGIEKLGPKAAAAVPYLIRQIDGRDPRAVGYGPKYLYRALAEIGKAAKPAIPLLLKKSRSVGDDTHGATEALGKLGIYDPDVVVPHLIGLMKKGIHQRDAVDSLGTIGKPAKAAIPHLIAKLNAAIASDAKLNAAIASNDSVVAPLISALVKIEEHDKIVRLLIAYLKRPQLVRVAADGLAEIEPPAAAAVPALIRALNKKDVGEDARYGLVDALGKISPKSIPVLEQLLIEATERNSLGAAMILAETDPLPSHFARKLRNALGKNPIEKNPNNRNPVNSTLQEALDNTHAR